MKYKLFFGKYNYTICIIFVLIKLKIVKLDYENKLNLLNDRSQNINIAMNTITHIKNYENKHNTFDTWYVKINN